VASASFRKHCPALRAEDSPAPASRSLRTIIRLWVARPPCARLRESATKPRAAVVARFRPPIPAIHHPWVDDHPNITFGDLTRPCPGVHKHDAQVKQRESSDPRSWPDPYFPAGLDTLRSNLSKRSRHAGRDDPRQLQKIARQCDCVRCDLAMLVRHDIFFLSNLGGFRQRPFWPRAIECCAAGSNFCFMGRGLLGTSSGSCASWFRLRLRQAAVRTRPRGPAGPCVEALQSGLDYQEQRVLFSRTTNSHAPPRRFRPDVHEAAAVIRTCRRVCGSSIRATGRARNASRILVLAPRERVDARLQQSSDELLAILAPPVGR